MNNSSPNYFEDGSAKKRRPFLIFPWLICLITAFGIWLYVMNVNSDVYEKTFTLIDIAVEGAEDMESLSNLSVVEVEGGKLSVTVTGLRSDIAELTAEDFMAYIDISTLDSAGKHACEVKLKTPATVSVTAKEPSSISVSVDSIKTVEVPVIIEKSSYSMSSDYYLGEITTDISSVNVTGPGTIIDRIVAARAEIGLGSQLIQSSLTQRLVLTLVGKDGKIVESPYVSVDKTSVTVNIPVRTDATVPLKYKFADGYDAALVESVEISVPSVKITGDPQAVTRISEIVVLVIDGTVGAENLVNVSDLLPDGVTVKDGGTTAMIKVKFKPAVAEGGVDTPIEEPSVPATSGTTAPEDTENA